MIAKQDQRTWQQVRPLARPRPDALGQGSFELVLLTVIYGRMS